MNSKKLFILIISVLTVKFWGISNVYAVETSENPQPNYEISSSSDFFTEQQRLLDKINKDFEEFFNNEFFMDNKPSGFIHMDNFGEIYEKNFNGLKTEKSKDNFKIIIDLKPFNKDESNINIKVKENTVSISAKYKAKSESNFSSSQFYQSLTLPEEFDLNALKQEKQGDSLIITIPKKLNSINPN